MSFSRTDPTTTAARAQAGFRKALALHQRGDLSRAKSMYESILASEPRDFDAMHMLGVIAYQSGQAHIAHDLISRALFIRSDLAPPHVNLALALGALGRFDEALASFNRALRLRPDHPTAHHDRGNVLMRLGRVAEAVASFDEAIALRPDHVEARVDRGNALSRLNYVEEALSSYEGAIALRPGYALAHYNRGNMLMRLGRLEDSLASYDRALATGPAFPELHNNRGNVLFDLHRMKAAVASFDQALALRPSYPEALNNRGNALWHLARQSDALESYERAIALKPDYAEAHNNRGNALLAIKRPAEALSCFRRVQALNPDQPFLSGVVLLTRMKSCDWDGMEQDIAAYRHDIRSGDRANTPFPALVLFDDPELQKLASSNYMRTVSGRAAPAPLAARAGGGRIRLGYYSADFHNHATSYLMAELFERHDRERFELFAFSFGADPRDAMRARVAAAFEHFIDVDDKSDREVVTLSRELGIDIAVDLKGYTENARPGIFAERCAPIQVNYLGYPGTLGADCFDYMIADKVTVPSLEADHYSEKLVYLPGSYQVNDRARAISERCPTRAEAGLPEEGFVFCCFNTNAKILPAMFDSWMRILGAVDGSVLWLREDNVAAADNLRREAAARSLDPARLIFAQPIPLDEHLARHRLADLFLDTSPYNAHTTASDSLWAGLPVLTLSGRTFASRVAASLLHAIKLPELITESERDYEERAIELANKPSKLRKLKAKLERNRLATPLFDGNAFARNIERAYAEMQRRHLGGLPPDLIDLS